MDAAKEHDMCPHSWAWGPCKTAETMERNRLYNRDHPHRESPESRKKSNRKYRISSYGLTQELFDLLLEAQQNACGMCPDPFEEGLASLMHAYIVVSVMAGVRPGEARAIGWEQDVDLDGNPPSDAVLRADRAGGDTKTPRSRRALKLAQLAVEALREWQADQAAEREAAGSHWQDTGTVFTTATDTPLGARHIQKMFQDVGERAQRDPARRTGRPRRAAEHRDV